MSASGEPLVVNADDGGAHPEVDAAILAAATGGVLVRSVSVLAAGATARAFVPRARDAGLGIGLHLNLTEGAPVGGPYRTLTGTDGRFFGTKAEVWRRADHGLFDPEEVTREVRAQWRRLVDLGAAPDHVDGHNHVHLLPLVLAAVCEALSDVPGLWLRDASASACPPELRPALPPHCFQPGTVRAAAGRREWRTAARFVGFRFTHDPGAAAVAELATAVNGPTEWMVHPGCRPATEFTRDPRRRREAELLADPEFGARVLAWGHRATTFREAS